MNDIFVRIKCTERRRVKSRVAKASGANAKEEAEGDGGVNEENDDSVDLRETLKTRNPKGVRQTDRLEGAPEPVGDVIVDRGEPHEIEDAELPLREKIDDKIVGVLTFAANPVLELHLGPEIDEMDSKESEDDDPEHEHVLRRPRGRLRFIGDGVLHRTRACG